MKKEAKYLGNIGKYYEIKGTEKREVYRRRINHFVILPIILVNK